MGFKVIDKGYNNYKKSFQDLNSKKVDVGVFEESGENVLIKAIVNEYGTTKAGKNRNIVIPERSFLRSTFNKNYKKISKKFSKIPKLIRSGRFDVMRELKLIGLYQKNQVKKTIIDFKDPANALSTIKNKGFDNPLIETGQLLKSISFKILKKWAVLENTRWR